jgi:hypothetical protein
MMEAKLLSEFFKILTRRIADIGPDDIAICLAQLANVSRKTVISKPFGGSI